MIRFNFSLIFLAICIFVNGQIITSIPTLPQEKEETTIIFDAKLGNGALAGFSGDIYAHTGVITSNSSNGTDWQHEIAGWSQNTDKAKMTALGNDKYQLVLSPSIREFYDVVAGRRDL
jgi:hypothetical protein